MKKLLFALGTRPEAIKMAPLVKEFERRGGCLLRIVSTAQHREMLDQMLSLFSLKPDRDLNIMRSHQSLAELTARLPLPLDRLLAEERPDLVLVQGDTTTAFLTALACFYRKIPLGHVEAGLRSGDRYAPFPEEINRSLIGRLGRLHFAPTEEARRNLVREGIDAASISVTGNTVIDALFSLSEQAVELDPRLDPDKALILVTAHRRENFGERLLQIYSALKALALQNPDVQILYPVHRNPCVSETARSALEGCPGILLSEPLPYGSFIASMRRARFVLSDSGGVQEEAPALGKPLLILREKTERPEGLEAGGSLLVGSNPSAILEASERLLRDPLFYSQMAVPRSPFGDGKASQRIADAIERYFLEDSKS